MEEKLNGLSFVNAALLGFLIAVGYYVFFFHPADPQTQLDAMEQEISTLKGEIAQLDRKIKKNLDLKAEIQAIEDKANRIYVQLPENLSVDKATSTISQKAREVGLSIRSIQPEGGWQKRETIAVAEITTSVLGSFNQIMIFLSELSRSDKVYSVSDIKIAQNVLDASSGAVSLSLDAKIQAYRRLNVDELSKNSGGE